MFIPLVHGADMGFNLPELTQNLPIALINSAHFFFTIGLVEGSSHYFRGLNGLVNAFGIVYQILNFLVSLSSFSQLDISPSSGPLDWFVFAFHYLYYWSQQFLVLII